MKTTSNLKRYVIALGMIAVLLGVSDLTLGKGSLPAAPGDTEARFRLNEGSGTIAGDSSENGNDGTLQGDTAWVAGREGQGLTFDGAGDYVTCGSTGLVAANAAQSVTWWMKTASVPSRIECAIDIRNSTGASAIQLGFRGSKVSVWKHGGGVLVNTNPPSSGEWHHYAYTFDGTTHRLYVDGAEVKTSTATPQTDVPDTLVLGRCDFCKGEYFTGELDEVLVYSREITPAEVAGLAHDPAMELLLHLDEGAGTTTADDSGNDNDGTLTGGPTWVAGKEGQALSFDGTDDYVALSAAGMPAANAAQSMALWMKYASVPAGIQSAVDLHDSGSASAVQIGFRNSKITVWKHAGGVLVDATPPAAGSWHHVGYTFDGTTHRLYLNGSEAASSTATPQTGTPDTLSIGRCEGCGSELSYTPECLT